MFCKKLFINFAVNFESLSKKISAVLFVIVLIGAILSEKNNIIFYFSQAGFITLLLNILMMTIAFYIAKLFGSAKTQQKALVVEIGLQNGTLAIVVATTVFGGGLYLIPAATYSLIMFGSSLLYVYFARKF
jgi:BASS family bile acid:Na+ symporter